MNQEPEKYFSLQMRQLLESQSPILKKQLRGMDSLIRLTGNTCKPSKNNDKYH